MADFTTHNPETPLSPRGIPQATVVLCHWQTIAAWLLLGGLVAWGVCDWQLEVLCINAALMAFYLFTTLYRLLIICLALGKKRELTVEMPEGGDWPRYMVLVPLYHEGAILPHLIASLSQLDYPKDKLDIRLLIEEDDDETRAAAQAIGVAAPFQIKLIPKSLPRTKPKACNVGIEDGEAEYVVIFDAEDRPEPDQLKKAVLAFRNVPSDVACIQAKLNYYNSTQNLLTRCFTLDYATWFGLCLPGMDALRGPIPLGGTSNHFRLSILRECGGWDEYNVTEDCDLGLRLYSRGYRTRVLDSTTWEQACPRLGLWIRQRSRWVKGYLQTYFVHTRSEFSQWKSFGFWGRVQFHVLIGGSALSVLINPFYWLMTLVWLLFQPDAIQTLFPPVLYVAGSFCLFIGNFIFAYTSAIAVMRNGQGKLAKYCLLMPFYCLLISVAGWKGFLQLFTRPHHWEKTTHFAESSLRTGGEK